MQNLTAHAKPTGEVARFRRLGPNHPQKWRHVGFEEFATPVVDGEKIAFSQERREAPHFLAFIAVIAKQ